MLDNKLLNLFRLGILKIYFNKITIYNKENIPINGLTLYVSNHRNGAIDGYVLMKALPRYIAIVGKNLTKSLFLKLFFGGHIEIYRSTETAEEKAFNQKQLSRAVELIKKKQKILIFPEGTSKLGPSLLPIKKGAAFICKILLDSLETETKVYIVPIGLHYEAGWQFRSNAEVHFGTPILLQKENSKNLTQLTNTIKDGLLEVTANFTAPEEQKIGEAISTLVNNYDKSFSLFSLRKTSALKMLPQTWLDKFTQLCSEKEASLYLNAPIIGTKNIWTNKLYYYILTPFIFIAFILNLLPLSIPYFVAKKMSDDNNVITLWRILVGSPLFVIQWVASAVLGIAFLQFPIALVLFSAYILLSLTGLLGLDSCRRSRIMIKNQKYPKHLKQIKSLIQSFSDNLGSKYEPSK